MHLSMVSPRRGGGESGIRGLTFLLQILVRFFTLGQTFPYRLPHPREIALNIKTTAKRKTKARVRDSNTPSWIDKEVRHLLKRKESARRAAKKHNSAFYLEKFRISRKESKALINRKLKEYHTSLGDSLKVNPKGFWSYFRHKTKSNSIPANVTYGGRQISSGVEMAEAFNNYFYSTFTQAPEVPLDAFTPPDGRMPVLDSLVLCEDEV